MGSTAVDCFYRIAFPNERSFWQWTERIAGFAVLVRNVFVDRSELRAVIFVPQWPTPGAPPRAYVSAGACGIATRMSDGALIDRSTVISADELPPGLTMIFGDVVDETEYEKRHAWRRLARSSGLC
jgi:hypothetical protein